MSGNPIGQVFFDRKDSMYDGFGGTYTFDDPRHFYGNILVEAPLNNYISEAYLQRNLHWSYDHPRAFQIKADGGTGRDDTTHYCSMAVMYGGGPQSHKTTYRVESDGNPGREKSGSHPVLIPFRRPSSRNQGRMYIDLNMGLRRIVFPIMHRYETREVDNLCMAVQISFTLANSHRMVEVYDFDDNPTGNKIELKTNSNGWGIEGVDGYTLAFEVYDVITYLTTPVDQRKEDMSVWDLMRLYNADDVLSEFNPTRGSKRENMGGDHPNDRIFATQFYLGIDRLLSHENNIDLMYRPRDDTSIVVKTILGLISTAFSYIPVFGPIISVSYDYIVDAIAYPDELQKFNWVDAATMPLKTMGGDIEECTKYFSDAARKNLQTLVKARRDGN